MVVVAVTAVPLVLIVAAVVLTSVAVVRSLRDEAVLETLRAEVRSVGEVHRAVGDVRSSRIGRPTPR